MVKLSTVGSKFNLGVAAILFAIIASPVHASEESAEGWPHFRISRPLWKVREQLIGNSISAPSPESLVGQYLKVTGAKTVVRTFLTAPVGNANPRSEDGLARLVVPVSLKTFPEFAARFNNENMLYLFYEPNGSMQAAYRGMRGNYARLEDNVRYTAPGTMMVPIVLSDSEAARATRFFEMGRDPALNQYAQNPWNLVNTENTPWMIKSAAKGNQRLMEAVMASNYIRHYSAKTGFGGCTHWFTSIPLGDTLVKSYIFPSDQKDNVDGTRPYHQRLLDYDTPAHLSKAQETLLRSVWTVPGHQQLGEMLNPMASRRGEFTNVGWIAYSLLGSQGVDRVPVVFLFVDDVEKEIDPNYPVQINAH